MIGHSTPSAVEELMRCRFPHGRSRRERRDGIDRIKASKPACRSSSEATRQKPDRLRHAAARFWHAFGSLFWLFHSSRRAKHSGAPQSAPVPLCSQPQRKDHLSRHAFPATNICCDRGRSLTALKTGVSTEAFAFHDT